MILTACSCAEVKRDLVLELKILADSVSFVFCFPVGKVTEPSLPKQWTVGLQLMVVSYCRVWDGMHKSYLFSSNCS